MKLKKGFYKRSTNKNESYICTNENNCLMNKITRNRCKSCRYRKCIKEGMSIDSKKNFAFYFFVLKISALVGVNISSRYIEVYCHLHLTLSPNVPIVQESDLDKKYLLNRIGRLVSPVFCKTTVYFLLF